MPTVLALDTSTPDVSVAVRWSGGLLARRVPAGRRTGALLAPTVRDVMAAAGLAAADLDVVAVGVGPGPYTSLRAGIMFAKAVGVARGVAVVGACSLDVVARGLLGAGGSAAGVAVASTRAPDRPGGPDVVVAIDARRREVYWARYDAAGHRVAGPLVGPPEQVREANGDARWWGPGGVAGPDAEVLARWVAAEWAQAGDLAGVTGVWDGARGDGAAAGRIPQSLLRPEPLYLRRPDAVEPTVAAAVPT